MATQLEFENHSIDQSGQHEADNGQQLIASLPRSVKVEFDQGELEIREDWLRWQHPVTLTAIVALVGFAVVSANQFDVTLGSGEDQVPIWFVGIIACALTGLAYWAFAGIMNSTTIVASENQIRYRVGPLPWIGHLDAHVDEIDQFYVVQKYRMRRRELPWEWDDDLPVHRGFDWSELSFRSYQKIPCYQLVVQLKTGKVHALSVRYNTPYIPRVIEYLAERHLGIADRFVAAEHRGD